MTNPTKKVKRNPGMVGDLTQLAILGAAGVYLWQQFKAKALPGQ